MLGHYDFIDRRARKGQGHLKRKLMTRLREPDNEITHCIIAFVASKDPERDAQRDRAEAERKEVHAQLRAITMDPKP